MIRTLVGDHVQFYASEDGVMIRTNTEVLHLSGDQWRELVWLLRIVDEAASDRPA